MFDFRNVDTGRAEKFSDDELLKRIECLDLQPGYGLIAEVCKRFEKVNKKIDWYDWQIYIITLCSIGAFVLIFILILELIDAGII